MELALTMALPQWLQNQEATMFSHPLLHAVLLFLCFLFILFINGILTTKSARSPPSPPKLPIIGHLHKLGALPHQSLRDLSMKYGPLMLLQLGSTPTVVVSSAKIAAEVMKTHDITFSNRPMITAAKIFLYGEKDVGFAPYGQYWRQVRKMCVQDLLSAKRVESFRYIRDGEIYSMVNKIKQAALMGKDVDLSNLIINVTYSIISRICLGRAWEGKEDSAYTRLAKEVNDVFGLFSVEDMFPSLGWVDVLSGLRKRMTKTSKELHQFFDEVIKEHLSMNKVGSAGDRKDFVDLMLDYEKDPRREIEFTHENLRAILVDLFVAGTDTVYATIDWAMAEIVKNPEVKKRLQEEIRQAVGAKTQVDESDICHLDYLNCVIKETLRLHAPAALSNPRISSASADIEGCHIPARTRTIVNLWAIQRDPEMWERPEEFIPERFINNPIDFRGNDFEFIPFGAGRKGCPGISFSNTSVESVLANLLYWFDWEMVDGTDYMDIDMTETFGVSVRRKFPLRLVPLTRFP